MTSSVAYDKNGDVVPSPHACARYLTPEERAAIRDAADIFFPSRRKELKRTVRNKFGDEYEETEQVRVIGAAPVPVKLRYYTGTKTGGCRLVTRTVNVLCCPISYGLLKGRYAPRASNGILVDTHDHPGFAKSDTKGGLRWTSNVSPHRAARATEPVDGGAYDYSSEFQRRDRAFGSFMESWDNGVYLPEHLPLLFAEDTNASSDSENQGLEQV